jgi:hypothetical protein
VPAAEAAAPAVGGADWAVAVLQPLGLAPALERDFAVCHVE